MSTRNRLIWALVAALFVHTALADGIGNVQVIGTEGINNIRGGGSSAGCTQATTYLAAQSGLSGTQTSAYTAAICGLVTDGNFSLLDGLYFFANASAANAEVNVVNPGTFNLTPVSTPCSFTANSGFTGDGTCYFTSGFTPNSSGGSFASLGACILNSRTMSGNLVPLGTTNSIMTSYAYLSPLQSGAFQFEISGFTFPTAASSNAQGSWAAVRTSGTVSPYLNGSIIGSPVTDPVVSLSDEPIFVMAYNNGGPASNTTDLVGYVWYGKAPNSTQVSQIYSRLHTMMGALGASAC